MKEEDLLHEITKVTKIFVINLETVQQRAQMAQKTFGKGIGEKIFLYWQRFLNYK